MLKHVLCALAALFALSSCKTAPTLYSGVSEGNWRAKALIKDLEESKSYIVNLNINLVKNQRTRMDVTSSIGTGVASLVTDDKEVRYIIMDSKRFYSGAAQANAMRPILSIPFDPRWLANILLDVPIADKGWTCQRDAAGLLSECADPASGLKITWTDRNGVKKTVRLDHAKASLQIKVQSFKPKVEDRKNLFVLEAPPGFQKMRVR